MYADINDFKYYIEYKHPIHYIQLIYYHIKI